VTHARKTSEAQRRALLDTPQATLRKKHVWQRVEPVRPWRPGPGEDLIGYYLGQRTRLGQFGPYGIATLLVPNVGLLSLSGASLIALIECALLERGDLVRVVYLGKKVYGLDGEGKDKAMKTFERHRPEVPQVLPEDLLSKIRIQGDRP
jgi:hypothetical protein